MTVNYWMIGQRVREYRKQNQLTQADLAEQIDMSATYISHIETAKRKASLEALLRISNVLGITMDRLLSGNQTNDTTEYLQDLMLLINGCTSSEKKVIYDIALATKKSLRENKWPLYAHSK